MPVGKTESKSLEQSEESSLELKSFAQSQESVQSYVSAASEYEDDEYSSSGEDISLEEDSEAFRSELNSRVESQVSLPLSIFGERKQIKDRVKSTQPSAYKKNTLPISPASPVVSGIFNRIKNEFSRLLHAVAGVFGRNRAEQESASHVSLSRKKTDSVSRKRAASASRRNTYAASRKNIHSISRKKTDLVPPEKTDFLSREKTDSVPHKETEPGVTEILASQDTICWKSDNHTVVFKRNPDQYTVFEITQDGEPDKGKKEQNTEKKTPNIQKAKETSPLGTTVYRQPARGICIGSQQISGSVKVVLDYNQKVAFVQIISPKSEVYATYNVNSITFLTTCTPCGVAWIGDIYQPDNRTPTPGTGGSESWHFSGKSDSRSTKEIESTSYLRDWVRTTQQFPRKPLGMSSNHNQSSVPKPDVDNADVTPKQSSKTLQMLRAEEEELQRILRNDRDVQSKEDSTKKVSGGSKEEIISIDVVNVVFSNPNQVQRLIQMVEELKTALNSRVLPGSATFFDSTYSCSSLSDSSSTTSVTLSHASSDHESGTSFSPGYRDLASQFYNFQGSPKVSPEVTGQADGEQQKYITSTESPLRGHKDDGNVDKALQSNKAYTCTSDKNNDTSPGKQNGVQQATNNVSPMSSPNSHQQTGVFKKTPNIQNQPVVFSQNPCHVLNTMSPVYTKHSQLQTGYRMRDPSLALFLNSGNFENQLSPSSRNPMLAPTRNHVPSMYTNQMSSPFGKQMLSGSRNQMASPPGNTIPSIYANQIPTNYGNQMLLNSRNQMPLTSGNQMPLTIANQLYFPLGNQESSSWCQGRESVASNYVCSPLQNKKGRIFRSANPSSIRRQWSLRKPKACNKIRVCLISEPD